MSRKDVLSRAFLDAFEKEIRDAASHLVTLPRVPGIVWRQGDALHALRLIDISWPGPGKNDAPEIVRININHSRVPLTRSEAAHLALDSSVSSAPARTSFHLEWTVLGEQLVAFAPFIAAWLWMKTGPEARQVLPPPHACYIWGSDPRRIDYAWSIAAWQAQNAYRGQRGHMHRIMSVFAQPDQVVLADTRPSDAARAASLPGAENGISSTRA
jgi:hypothetical protein